MAFKLSNEACQAIAHGDYDLAYQEELERLHIKLEQTMNDRDTATVQGQIFQHKQHMGLRAKALNQLK